MGTGKEQKIRIESSSGLNENEIDQMVKDAEAHSEEDKNRREIAETKNNLDSRIYEIEKSLKEYGEKISEDEKKNLEEEIAKAKTSLESTDIQILKDSLESLTQASHKLAEVIYKESAANQQQEPASEEVSDDESKDSDKKPGKDENVVDADFEVVDEEKA